jgi:hypothetical protein
MCKCGRKLRGGTKGEERAARGAHEVLPKKTWRDKEQTKKKKKWQEVHTRKRLRRRRKRKEEEEKAARGAHWQVMEENLGVAQKEEERAARGAHEELPKKT